MKKIGAILCMIMIMLMMAPSASAAGFEITKTSPKDGATGVPLENMGVKVFFNQDVYSKDNEEANKALCKLLDKDGNEISTIVVFNSSEPDVMLVLADTEGQDGEKVTIEATSEYKLVIGSDFKAADGETLGTEEVVTFETLNPSSSTKISMLMMLVMVVGMVFASSRAKKHEEKKEEKVTKKDEKFNPYKVAKETGKSVDQVIAEENKRREKEAAKEARKAKHKKIEEEGILEEYEEVLRPGHYRVKSVRTVAQAGSTFITGKKAEAEKKAAIEAKIKASQGKKKPKKGKKRK